MAYTITEEQKEVLKSYGVAISQDFRELLIELDDKIIEIGLDKSEDPEDYELNDDGRKLQQLYDAIYYQNSEQ